MVNNGHYACPLCGVSMMDMSDVWKLYDKEIEETPMPAEYTACWARIQCRDCSHAALAPFHILGLKATNLNILCPACGQQM